MTIGYRNRSSDYSQCTPAALTDELVQILSSNNYCDLYHDESGNINMRIFRPYLNQAEGLIHSISVYEHPPEFVIWEEDIPYKLARALQNLGGSVIDAVITEAVRRLYESVDPVYFHVNGLYGKTPWRISKH